MKHPIKTILLTTLALAFGAASADPMYPGDAEGFHGYLRAGAGSTTADGGGPQSCYGLGGNTKAIAKSDNVTYMATLWVNALHRRPTSATARSASSRLTSKHKASMPSLAARPGSASVSITVLTSICWTRNTST